MSAAAKSASRLADEKGKAGAKAGAKARKRERSQEDAAIVATLAAEKSGRGQWTYTYRADGEARIGTVTERARKELTPAELLSSCREAARLAAGRLRARHGVPELSHDERDDLAAELVARLLADAGPGHLPKRERVTRGYLVERATGIVLDDPDRRADGEMPADDDPAAMLAAADSQARAKGARHDRMLNPGVDGTWPEVKIGCAACEMPSKATRAAAYLVCGGTVADDWAAIWKTTPGYARTRVVPEGTAALRAMSPEEAADLAGAIAAARLPDRLDRRENLRRSIELGLSARPDRARKVIERRWRVEPDEPAPVVTRIDRRIVVTSDRTRAKAARRAGWQAPRI